MSLCTIATHVQHACRMLLCHVTGQHVRGCDRSTCSRGVACRPPPGSALRYRVCVTTLSQTWLVLMEQPVQPARSKPTTQQLPTWFTVYKGSIHMMLHKQNALVTSGTASLAQIASDWQTATLQGACRSRGTACARMAGNNMMCTCSVHHVVPPDLSALCVAAASKACVVAFLD